MKTLPIYQKNCSKNSMDLKAEFESQKKCLMIWIEKDGLPRGFVVARINDVSGGL